ncbi:MAG TPA: hypothetical protein VNV85_10720 [Puia sp.]|jgi:hypothetical protein|nr:hypothetical protein [Puia sp.]
MSENESIGSFVKTNKSLLKQYLETRFEIFRLSSIRVIAKSAGYFVWIIISLFLFFLIILFAGITAGFWLSELMSSYVKGFGVIVGVLILLFAILAFFRKKLFVEPFMQIIIDRAIEELGEEENT